MVAIVKVASKATRLHESGRMDDRYLLSISEGAKSHFETSKLCSYNVRRPGHALPGFGQFDLLDSESNPVSEGARQILEAGSRGDFDRLMGKDNPRAEDAAPETAVRARKQSTKAQRTRKTRKQVAHA
jgi:hypothetical protein